MSVSHTREQIKARRELINQVQELPPIGPFIDPDNARREMEFNAFFVYALKKLDAIEAHEEQVFTKAIVTDNVDQTA